MGGAFQLLTSTETFSRELSTNGEFYPHEFIVTSLSGSEAAGW